jgi:DNA-binding PadR family transcriptional regulator
MHGYDVIQELESRSGGAWRPSPGSIYPTLQMLEDGGLVTSEDRDGKRVYSLTDAGKAEVEERKERTGDSPPWEFGPGGGEGQMQLRDAFFQFAAALMQVARTGTREQMKQASEIVAEARKKVYAILAQD